MDDTEIDPIDIPEIDGGAKKSRPLKSNKQPYAKIAYISDGDDMQDMFTHFIGGMSSILGGNEEIDVKQIAAVFYNDDSDSETVANNSDNNSDVDPIDDDNTDPIDEDIVDCGCGK